MITVEYVVLMVVGALCDLAGRQMCHVLEGGKLQDVGMDHDGSQLTQLLWELEQTRVRPIKVD